MESNFLVSQTRGGIVYPHVTQFQTIDNRRRELLAATAEAAPKEGVARRRLLLLRTPRVTSQPCR